LKEFGEPLPAAAQVHKACPTRAFDVARIDGNKTPDTPP